jgi:hypothetical protein
MTGHNVTLADLFKDQAAFVSALETRLGEGAVFGNRQIDNREFLVLVLAIHSELSEAVEVIVNSTKPWKTHDPNVTREELIGEFVDVFIFLIEVFLFLGLEPDDVASMTKAKIAKNMERLFHAAVSS